jgi:hypothetical protein
MEKFAPLSADASKVTPFTVVSAPAKFTATV